MSCTKQIKIYKLVMPGFHLIATIATIDAVAAIARRTIAAKIKSQWSI